MTHPLLHQFRLWKMHAMSEQKSFKFKYFLMLNIYKQPFSLCFRAKCSPPTQPAGLENLYSKLLLFIKLLDKL